MERYIVLNGQSIPIEPPEEAWASTIRSGSDAAARKIANELDRVAKTRLLPDQRKLRDLIRDIKGF
jgi:hypothetical protein